VQILLGHSRRESTVRYLGIELDDALEIFEQTEIQRSTRPHVRCRNRLGAAAIRRSTRRDDSRVTPLAGRLIRKSLSGNKTLVSQENGVTNDGSFTAFADAGQTPAPHQQLSSGTTPRTSAVLIPWTQDSRLDLKALTNKYYRERLQRVLDYIDEHLDDDLRIEVLCDVAAFSKFHFHRQFGATFGISVGRYIRLTRLQRASRQLGFNTEMPVTEIALTAGYDSPEAFSRAFKDATGKTPSAYRKAPEWGSLLLAYPSILESRSTEMHNTFTPDQVELIELPAIPVARMSHYGNPAQLHETIRKFIAWRKSAGLSPEVSATFNIFHVEQDTAPDDYRVDLCASTDRAVPVNDQGVTALVIPAGHFAMLRVVGWADDLEPAATFLYRDWLPASGLELGDFPMFCRRVRFFPYVSEDKAITELFLPLRLAAK
jgi:AraC family transcriptional regulator